MTRVGHECLIRNQQAISEKTAAVSPECAAGQKRLRSGNQRTLIDDQAVANQKTGAEKFARAVWTLKTLDEAGSGHSVELTNDGAAPREAPTAKRQRGDNRTSQERRA